MDTQPQLADVVHGAILSELDTRWTAELGRIISYDPAKRWASVQILASNRYVAESGDVVAERIAPLVAVPVVRLGGGKFRLSMPITEGDECLVVCCGTPVGNWKIVGGDYDSGYIGREHHLEGAVAIVGLAPSQANDEINDPDAAVLGSASGAKVRVSESEVQLGDPSTSENVGTVTDLSILLGMWSDPGIVAGIAAASVDGGTTLATAIAAYLGTAGTPSGSSAVKASR